MARIKSLVLLQAFAADEEGATAIEYTLIIAMIALGIIGTLEDIGPTLSAIYSNAAALLAV